MTEPAAVEITAEQHGPMPAGERQRTSAARSAWAATGPGGPARPAKPAHGGLASDSPRSVPIIATVLPDDKGLGLLDLLSGSPLRVLDRPDHTIVGVLGESTGRRLVTIEHVAADAATSELRRRSVRARLSASA